MPRNYNDGSWRSVTIKGYAELNYGFLSRVDASLHATLGQAIINSSTTGLVIGCNAPKPGRASKKRTTGRESGFYSNGSTDKTTELKAAGWQLTAGKRRLPNTTKVSASYYVEVGGVKYAWQLTFPPGGVPPEYAAAASAKLVDENDLVVWGCSYPKPASIEFELAGQGVFRSFADPTALDTLPDGWDIARPARVGNNYMSRYFT